jgi:hypothetical protein
MITKLIVASALLLALGATAYFLPALPVTSWPVAIVLGSWRPALSPGSLIVGAERRCPVRMSGQGSENQDCETA